jgi:hypothetical protein
VTPGRVLPLQLVLACVPALDIPHIAMTILDPPSIYSCSSFGTGLSFVTMSFVIATIHQRPLRFTSSQLSTPCCGGLGVPGT